MTAVRSDCDERGVATRAPRLLYVNEFPPSNHHGGAILVKRLLDKQPADCLVVIASKNGMKASPATDLCACRHIALPFSGRSRYLGIRRLLRGLGFALVVSTAILEIRRKRIEAVITIVAGRYYLAAALAAWVTATPHITIVNDSFISGNASRSISLGKALRYLTRKVLRNAAHVYAVSPEMQRLIFKECGVEAEVQLPSTTMPPHAEGQTQIAREGGPVILFAGTAGYEARDCLDLLADLIATGQLKEYGMSDAKLHLCTALTDTEMRARGWVRDGIVSRGWVPQSELPKVLSGADILFLPYSFLESSREAVETAFPSKIADYLAAGKPILVFGPRYSSLVRYASEQGFAEIVDEFSPAALALSIQKIVFSPAYKERLAARALEVFSANHDIRCQQQKFYLTLERIVHSGRDTGAKVP